jgi:hypothetical protein
LPTLKLWYMASLKKHGFVKSISYYLKTAPGGFKISVHSTSEAYGAWGLGENARTWGVGEACCLSRYGTGDCAISTKPKINIRLGKEH